MTRDHENYFGRRIYSSEQNEKGGEFHFSQVYLPSKKGENIRDTWTQKRERVIIMIWHDMSCHVGNQNVRLNKQYHYLSWINSHSLTQLTCNLYGNKYARFFLGKNSGRKKVNWKWCDNFVWHGNTRKHKINIVSRIWTTLMSRIYIPSLRQKKFATCNLQAYLLTFTHFVTKSFVSQKYSFADKI